MSGKYSLREKSKKYDHPTHLFEALEGRPPIAGEFITCHVHSHIMRRSFLKTLDFKEASENES